MKSVPFTHTDLRGAGDDGVPHIPAACAERFGAREVHHFAECGHWLPAEVTEEVAERVVRFLSR